MSRNVIKTMEKIIDTLRSYISDEDQHRIKLTKCNIKANVEDEGPVIDFVAKSKTHKRYIKDCFLSAFKYRDNIYLVVPSRYEDIFAKIGLDIISDPVIVQGVGMLAISEKILPLLGEKSSLDIINSCLGEDVKELLFSEILELFARYIVVSVTTNRFAMQYEEDLDRLYAIMLLEESTLDEYSKSNLESLLLLQSSRSLAATICNALRSIHWEYSYLQLYQCLEYLFIVNNAISLSSEYSLNQSTAIDIVASGRLHTTEIDSLVSVLGLTPQEYIDNFYEQIIDVVDGMVDDGIDKKNSVAKYIYKIRCNIAHLKFEQERLKIEGKKDLLIKCLVDIIFYTYDRNDSEILKLCNSKSPWKHIVWKGK